jgi:hypothetical protein
VPDTLLTWRVSLQLLSADRNMHLIHAFSQPCHPLAYKYRLICYSIPIERFEAIKGLKMTPWQSWRIETAYPTKRIVSCVLNAFRTFPNLPFTRIVQPCTALTPGHQVAAPGR